MKVNNVSNQMSFSGFVLKPSASKASYRGLSLLDKQSQKIVEEAKDVDVVISGKFMQDIACDVKTDFVVKISKKLPEATNAVERIRNYIMKPFMPNKKNLAGWNYGFFDDPLTVVQKTKKELLDSLQETSKK